MRAIAGLVQARSNRTHHSSNRRSPTRLGANSPSNWPPQWFSMVSRNCSRQSSVRARPTAAAGLTSTKALTRCGQLAAYIAAHPASTAPMSAERSRPTASMTAARSSICCSSVAAPSTGSESPVPRGSKRTSRANDAYRSNVRAVKGSSHCRSRCDAGPLIITRSTGPSPITWNAIRASPLRAKLVGGSRIIPPETNHRNPSRRGAWSRADEMLAVSHD